MCKLLSVFLLLGAIIILPGCTWFSSDSAPAVQQEPITIGFISDLSAGGAKDHGISSKQGFELAVEEINASGGLLGRQVRTIIKDDQADPDLSRQQAEEVILQEKAVAIVGPVNSGNALNWYDLAQDNEVPTISAVASASVLTTQFAERPRNYIFRVSMTDKEQARLYVAWAVRQTKNGQLAVISDSTGYGKQGAIDFKEVLGRWGKAPVADEVFEREETVEQLMERVKRVRDTGAEGVLLFCLADSTAKLLQAFDRLDYDAVTFGPWSSLASVLNDDAGPLAERMIFTASTTFDTNNWTLGLDERIADKFGSTPVFTTAAQGYDATMLLAAAIRQAGTTEGAKVQEKLENLDNVQGVIKLYDKPFGPNNHEALSVVDFNLAHWVNGRVVKYTDENFENLEIR